MTALIDRVVGGAGLGSHSSKFRDIFCNALGYKYANFQQKISLDTNSGMSQTSHWSNFITMENLIHSTDHVGCYFLLKIGILRAKGIPKNVILVFSLSKIENQKNDMA